MGGYAEGEPGDTVTVPITLENNPGIVSMKLSVAYDENVLEPVSGSIGTDFAGDTGAMAIANVNRNPMLLNWIMGTNVNVYADSQFALLTFRIKDDAASGGSVLTITYDPEDVYDETLTNQTFSVRHGLVGVVKTRLEGEFSLTPEEPVCGDTVTCVANVTTPDAGEITYDWSRVTYSDSEVSGTYVQGEHASTYTATEADIGYYLACDIHAENCDTMRRVITSKPVQAYAADTDTDFTFAVSDASGKAGEEVEVTISIENNPGIITTQVDLSYENTKLQLLSATDAGLLKGDVTFTNNLNRIPFIMAWNDWSALENNTENGVFVTLKFKILEDCEPGEVPVTISIDKGNVFDFDLQLVDFAIRNGKITVEADGAELLYIPAKAATCTEDGNLAYWYCEDCGKFFFDSAAEHEISVAETSFLPMDMENIITRTRKCPHVYKTATAAICTVATVGN